MGISKLKVVLTEEAQAFLDAQPFKAQQKIYYNIFKVEEGVMTPLKEITKAEEIRKEYFNNKNK